MYRENFTLRLTRVIRSSLNYYYYYYDITIVDDEYLYSHGS